MRTIETGKYKGKTLANCPVEYLEWASKHEHVYAKSNRWVSRDAKQLLERKDMIIEQTLRPYGCHSEELAVGCMVDGEFKVERGIWNVTKDNRLKVTRKYEGKGAQTDVHFHVEVPADYPLTIAKKRKVGHGLTSTSWEYETLYTPVA